MAIDFPAGNAGNSPFEAPNGVTYTWNADGYWEAENDPSASYVLPIASDSVLGGVKVGARLSIAGDGTLSADAQGGDGGATVGSLQEVTDVGNTTDNAIQVGGNANSGTETGSRVYPGGIQCTQATPGSGLRALWDGYEEGNSTPTSQIYTTGAASFAGGELTINQSGNINKAYTISCYNNGTYNDSDTGLFNGYNTAGVETSSIKADGSAEFASGVGFGTGKLTPGNGYPVLVTGNFSGDDNWGEIRIASDNVTQPSISVNQWNGTDAYVNTVGINSNGSATFAGRILSGDGAGSDDLYGIVQPGYVAGRNVAANQVFSGALVGGAETSRINGDGSATFAGGNITLNANGRIDQTRAGGDAAALNQWFNGNNGQLIGTLNVGAFYLGTDINSSSPSTTSNIQLNANGFITTETDNGHVNFNVTNGAILVSPDGLSANATAIIDHDGSATFAGDGIVRGTLSVTGTGNGNGLYVGDLGEAIIKKDGTATFAGQVTTEFAFVSRGEDGAGYLFQGQNGGSEVCKILNDGSATFDGSIDVHSEALTQDGVRLRDFGCVQIRRDGSPSPNRILELYKDGNAASNITASIANDGSAEFKGIVGAEGTDTSARLHPTGLLFVRSNSVGLEVRNTSDPDAVQAQINADGSAIFESHVISGGRISARAVDGGGNTLSETKIYDSGLVRSVRPSGSGQVIVFQGGTVDAENNARIFADGSAEFVGTVTDNTSDIKFKENIVDATSQLADVTALRLRSWNWRSDAIGSETRKARHTTGLVAQEAETVDSKLVYEAGQGDDTFKAIDYKVLTMKLLGAVQELEAARPTHVSFDASAGNDFDFSTAKIASHNVESVERTAKGKFTITFTNAFASDKYTAVATAGDEDHGGTGASPRCVNVVGRTATSLDIVVERSDDAVQDDDGYISVFIAQ